MSDFDEMFGWQMQARVSHAACRISKAAFDLHKLGGCYAQAAVAEFATKEETELIAQAPAGFKVEYDRWYAHYVQAVASEFTTNKEATGQGSTLPDAAPTSS